MLGIMLQKLWHKKWMAVCMLLGSILLVATVVSFPLYRNAAFDRMLQDEYSRYLDETGKWPVINKMLMTAKKDIGGATITRMENFTNGIYGELGLNEEVTVMYYLLTKTKAHSLMDRGREGEFELRPGYLSNIQDHSRIIAGEGFSETGVSKNGAYEVIISEATMVEQNLIIGETIEFEGVKDKDGKKLVVEIVGVFDAIDRKEFYWQVSPETITNALIFKDDVFRELFLGDRASQYTITCTYYALSDYKAMTAAMVDTVYNSITYLMNESPYRATISKCDYVGVLETYKAKQTRIDTTLFILQIPVLILLCAFLMMISSQMYDMERNEISVIKSRGASGGQIFRLYLYQSMFLSAIGTVLGLLLGGVFCRLLGSADNFLQFNFERELTVKYTKDVMLYALASFAVSIIIMAVPAIKHSKVSIVKLKQQKAAKKRSWWEIIFLDIIFLGISIYGFYNYSTNTAAMTERVLRGKPLDPLLYVSSSLFILGTGLLVLRLQPLIVKGIYALGSKWWRPASYASFMETLKNGRKQQFIMLFMILTVSLGIFNATVARTILQNARDNQEYVDGVDIIVYEKWSNNASSQSTENQIEFRYFEPDYSKYAKLTGARKYTRVLYDEGASVKLSGKESYAATVMGIHTKEFGQSTWVDEELLGRPYYEILNELALEPNGVILSSNMATKFNFKVGDKIDFTNSDGSTTSGKILSFVSYWPGYVPTNVTVNEQDEVVKTDNYLIVANLSTLQQYWGITPYQVWITTKDDSTSEYIYKWINENDVPVKKFTDRDKNIENVTKDPLLQGTNGILTMSFIVTIILCVVGYLIYWIMSIRSREMIFGILRANGLHKGEIFHMLILEQIFSGIFAALTGIVIGNISAKMFVPMLQSAYAAANQVLPMKLITNAGDMARLYGVTGAGMVLCLFILTMIVFKLNVAKALKLGEE